MEYKCSISSLVRNLRRDGWRVRNGPWPDTLAAEARWDFCRGKDWLCPMTEEAQVAMQEVMDMYRHA